MGTRELLILILGLAVIAVILRGLYVALQARRNQIRLAIDKNIPQDLDLEELEMSELPNGGARVVGRSLEAVNQRNILQNELDLGAQSEPDEAVPILLDTVEIRKQEEQQNVDVEPSINSAGDLEVADFDESDAEDYSDDEVAVEEETLFESESEADYSSEYGVADDERQEPDLDFDESLDDEFDDFSMTAGERIGGSGSNQRTGTGIANRFNGSRAPEGARKDKLFSRFGKKNPAGRSDEENLWESEPDPLFEDYQQGQADKNESVELQGKHTENQNAQEEPARHTSSVEAGADSKQVADINQARESRRPAASTKQSDATPAAEQNRQPVEPQEVLVVNVMSREGELLNGADLLQVLLSAGLKHGDMNIFHKHVDNDAEMPVIYSVANILNPGTFDLDTMDEFSTRGISLFLAMPSIISNRDAFEDMLRTAQQIRAALDGELRDDHRSVMTVQTIEHYRERIHNYELRKLKAAQVRS